MNWIERPVPAQACLALQQAGLPDLLARLLAARGVRHANETELALNQLLPPADMKGIDEAARLIQARKPCCIAGDEALLRQLPRGDWIASASRCGVR